MDCGYSLEPPRRGGSNEYPQCMFRAEIWKISQFLCLKILNFWRRNFLYIWIGVFSQWIFNGRIRIDNDTMFICTDNEDWSDCGFASWLGHSITKTYLYNFDPLKPHFYIVKLGYRGVYTFFFLFLLKNIDFWYSLEPPRRGGSNEYPQAMFWGLGEYQQSIFWVEIWKISKSKFLSENFQVLAVSFLQYIWIGVFS